MMLHIFIVVPSSIFWSIILLFLYIRALNITRVVTYSSSCIMQILALTGDEQEGFLFKIYQSAEKREKGAWHMKACNLLLVLRMAGSRASHQ